MSDFKIEMVKWAGPIEFTRLTRFFSRYLSVFFVNKNASCKRLLTR